MPRRTYRKPNPIKHKERRQKIKNAGAVRALNMSLNQFQEESLLRGIDRFAHAAKISSIDLTNFEPGYSFSLKIPKEKSKVYTGLIQDPGPSRSQ